MDSLNAMRMCVCACVCVCGVCTRIHVYVCLGVLEMRRCFVLGQNRALLQLRNASWRRVPIASVCACHCVCVACACVYVSSATACGILNGTGGGLAVGEEQHDLFFVFVFLTQHHITHIIHAHAHAHTHTHTNTRAHAYTHTSESDVLTQSHRRLGCD